MIINRVWAMPNKNTFAIPPIAKLLDRVIVGKSVDPFANSNRLATVTNDLDPQYETDYHLDALDFLKSFEDDSIDTVLFDPPYSAAQLAESYKKLGRSVNFQTTSSNYWRLLKKELARIIVPGGAVVSCGWNSGGVGEKYGYKIVEILLVAHGGLHPDTIVTIEKKNELPLSPRKIQYTS